MINFQVINLNDFYKLEDKEQKKYIERIKKEIKKSDNEVLKKMDRIVKRNVKQYQSDFYLHDICLMNEHPGPFLWLIRESGTDFIPLENINNNLISWYDAVKKINTDFYFYNRKTLKKINIEEADKIINEYQKN